MLFFLHFFLVLVTVTLSSSHTGRTVTEERGVHFSCDNDSINEHNLRLTNHVFPQNILDTESVVVTHKWRITRTCNVLVKVIVGVHESFVGCKNQ